MSSPSLPDSAPSTSHAQVTRVRQPRTLPPRKSLAESPPTQLPKRQNRPHRAAKGRLYPIRNIVDEDEARYLIDWEDDPVTGVAWPQSWEPKSHVTKKAIQDWDFIRRERLEKAEEKSTAKNPQESSQESLPVRTAKRKRKSSVVEKEVEVGLTAGVVQQPSGGESLAELDHLHKKTRKVGTVETARFSTLQTQNLPVIVREEIPDSFDEEESLDPRSVGQVKVIIPYNADFNRGAYPEAAKSVPSTQEYAPTIPSPLRNLVRREVVIPDSQETQGSPPYQSTSASRSGIEAASETDVSHELEPESLNDFSFEDIPSAQPISVPVNTQSLEPLGEEDNYQAPSINLEQTPKSVSDHEEHQTSTQYFSGPRAQSEDLQFQTQVPYFYGNISRGRDIVDDFVRGTSLPLTRRSEYHNHDSLPFLDSIYSKPSQEHQTSSKPKERRTSSGPDETWQSAQVLPAIDFSGSHARPSATPGIANTIQATQNSQTCQSSTLLDPELHNSSSYDQQPYHFSDQSPDISLNIGKDPELKRSRTQKPSSSEIHLPETYKGEYPPRPETPCDIDMADEELSYLEKLQRTREASRAKFIAKAKEAEQARINSQQSTRSPSNASSAPPTTMVDIVDSSSAPNLPIREPSPGPAVKSVEEESAISEDRLSPDIEVFNLSLPVFGPTDRILSLPIISSVRDVYEAEVRNNKQDIKSLVNNRQIDTALIQRIDAMVEKLNLITDHQDLADVSETQSSLSEEMQAKWAETTSSKCLFTRELLDALRSHNKHVAILARPGQMLDILELVLKVNGFVYNRPDRMTQSSQIATGSPQVTLLPTGLGGPQYVVTRADIVIAFDETFRKGERYSKILRAGISEPQNVSLLISLVVANSAEYMELCLPKTASPLRRKRALVQCIWQKRGEVGNLDKYPSPDEAAIAVADFLVKNPWQDSLWPLPENPQIEGVRPISDEPVEQQSASTTQPRDEQQSHTPMPLSSIKRTLDVEASEGIASDSKKRMRMTPSPGGVASSGDITRVSESIGRLSPPKFENDQRMKDDIGEDQESEDSQSVLIRALKSKVTELENDVYRKNEQVRSLEARNEDYVKSIRNIQPKYREAIQDRGIFEVQAKDAQVATTTLTQRIEARDADIKKLRDRNAVLESELEEARAVLKLSPNSLIAQLETALEKGRTSEVDNTRLEKRLSSLQKDFDFTRDSYQKASTAAAEFSNELSELKDIKVVLERKASENTLRIAQIQRSNEAKEREEHIVELQALLKERESELQRKSEELKAKTNGRRETRGSSVPRSPRMGSGAMSPRTYARIPAVGSRGNSPAPGDTSREGFRDTVLFPPSGVAPHRWQHLT